MLYTASTSLYCLRFSTPWSVIWDMGTPSTHLTSCALGRLSKARYGLRSKSDGRVNDGMMTQGRATGHRKGDATRGWAPCAQRPLERGVEVGFEPPGCRHPPLPVVRGAAGHTSIPALMAGPARLPSPPSITNSSVTSIDPLLLYIYRLCAHRRRPTWSRNGRVAAMQTLMYMGGGRKDTTPPLVTKSRANPHNRR